MLFVVALRRMGVEVRRLSLAGAAVLVGVLTQVMINSVTENPPGWLANPVVNWLVLAGLVLLLVVFAVLPGRSAGEGTNFLPGRLVAARPRLGSASELLRPPTLDRPVRGRDAELELLQTLCREPAGRFAVVCGAGGMGKTALAAEFAHRAGMDGLVVFWVRHRSVSELDRRLEEVAVATGLSPEVLGQARRSNADVIGLAWNHLNQTSGWVVVLDNLDHTADAAPTGEQVREYRGWVRPSTSGLLVITSRDRHPDTWGPAAVLVDLDPLSDRDGAKVLCDAAPGAGTTEQAQAVSARLGGLPLALRAAGAVLAEPTSRHRSFTNYLHALADHTANVLPVKPNVADPDTVRRLVGYTWDLSLNQLTAAGLTLATPVLQLLSMLADAPVPRLLLSPDLLGAATGEAVTIPMVDAAVAGLHRYGLITVPDTAQTLGVAAVALHPVVRETTATRLDDDDHAPPLRAALDHALSTAVDDVVRAGREGWDSAQLLTPHVLTLRYRTHPAFHAAREVLHTLANLLHDAGRPSTELDLRHTLLTDCERVLGPDHSDTLDSRNNLAEALAEVGRSQEAVELHRHTLTARERILGSDHPDTLISRYNLAAALRDWGRPQEAVELLRETLTACERILGPDHADTLESRNNLAEALRDLGQYQEAVELHRQTLTACERIHGLDHPHTLGSRNNLAAALRGLGQSQEAVELHREIIAACERTLGADHPHTLVSRNNLATALRDLRRYQEATELLREALTACEHILGTDHPHTLYTRNNLAEALRGWGQNQESVRLHRETLAARERILGTEHPHTLVSRHNLAEALASVSSRPSWRRRLQRRKTTSPP